MELKEKKKRYHKQWRDLNREHLRKQGRDRYQQNKETFKLYRIKNKFGLTGSEYAHLLSIQNHCCGICGKHESTLTKPINVDHCHNTNTVRGLLCWDCNVGLGKLGDNIEGLMKAIKYLENNDNKLNQRRYGTDGTPPTA